MLKNLLFAVAGICLLQACNNNPSYSKDDCKKGFATHSTSTNTFVMENNNTALSCRLTTPELQKRKETVIASLKKQVLEKKELPDGYAFKFEGSDQLLDELTEFIKSERACCSFFTFGIIVNGDGKATWLNLTGPNGTKEMITSELGL
jgi:hypothetical protein